MATPTYEEMLEGSTRWTKKIEGVSVLLSHHGYRKEDPSERSFMGEGHPGTWAYYLIIPEQMYPHRWADFACERGSHGFFDHGPAFSHDFFDTEITWASSEPYWCRRTNRMWDASKVGCDYGHSWQRDMGYQDTYSDVKRDAEHTVKAFLAAHPDRHLRCSYSGIWAPAEEFYTASNGASVHQSQEGRATKGKYGSIHWARRAIAKAEGRS